MNIAKIMIPKPLTRILHATDTVRQALETMENHGFTAIPVLDDAERYIGCVTEGDFLRHVLRVGDTDKKVHENYLVGDLVRKDFCEAIAITAPTDDVVRTILNQNFVPVVDDRNVLCGILTRKGVIQELAEDI
ncbi:MAG: CBS domain-containing protein [Lachnospiraceae bacterium]|nr:CBS domain-containing protein [Lachnospiraceae bacterium]